MSEDLRSGSAGTPQTADLAGQAGPSRLFVKLYMAALETGFLAAISDRDWRTLCVLALHMDAEGQCYPALTTLARELGVNLSTASQRVQSLLHAGLSREDFCALIDWGLAHPFWHDKITRMQQVVQLVGQWQQQDTGRRPAGGYSISDAGAAGRHPDLRALDALVVRSGTGGV